MPEEWQLRNSATTPVTSPKKSTQPKPLTQQLTTPKPKKKGPFTTEWHNPIEALRGMGFLNPFGGFENNPSKPPITSEKHGVIDSLRGMGFLNPFSGFEGKGQSTAPTSPNVSALQALAGATQADILLGKVPIPDIDTSDANKDWVKFREKNPGIARAITDKQNLEYQKLLKQAEQGEDTNPVGNAVLDPMAVQLLFQNSINPFLNSVVQGANSQTQNYQGMMNQLMNSSSLPEPYRNVLRTQVPQQANNMNQLTTALAGYTATSPSIQSLLNLMNKDYQAQQRRIYEEQSGQQAALSGQLFSQLLGQ